MQEAPHSESGEQLPADAAVSLRRAHRAHPAGAEREPAGVPPGGAGRMQSVEEERPGGGGGPVQHAAHRSQRAALEGRQGASLSQMELEKKDRKRNAKTCRPFDNLEGPIKIRTSKTVYHVGYLFRTYYKAAEMLEVERACH